MPQPYAFPSPEFLQGADSALRKELVKRMRINAGKDLVAAYQDKNFRKSHRQFSAADETPGYSTVSMDDAIPTTGEQWERLDAFQRSQWPLSKEQIASGDFDFSAMFTYPESDGRARAERIAQIKASLAPGALAQALAPSAPRRQGNWRQETFMTSPIPVLRDGVLVQPPWTPPFKAAGPGELAAAELASMQAEDMRQSAPLRDALLAAQGAEMQSRPGLAREAMGIDRERLGMERERFNKQDDTNAPLLKALQESAVKDVKALTKTLSEVDTTTLTPDELKEYNKEVADRVSDIELARTATSGEEYITEMQSRKLKRDAERIKAKKTKKRLREADIWRGRDALFEGSYNY
jgi:hypothetical protein